MDESQKMAVILYGKEHQVMIAIEEMSELVKELSKEYRGYENIEAIIEEMADVYICLEQLQIIFGISDSDLDTEIDKKMNRNMKRMIEELSQLYKEEEK